MTQKWEYANRFAERVETLDAFGKDGWEAYGVCVTPLGHLHFLKRPLPEPKADVRGRVYIEEDPMAPKGQVAAMPCSPLANAVAPPRTRGQEVAEKLVLRGEPLGDTVLVDYEDIPEQGAVFSCATGDKGIVRMRKHISAAIDAEIARAVKEEREAILKLCDTTGWYTYDIDRKQHYEELAKAIRERK